MKVGTNFIVAVTASALLAATCIAQNGRAREQRREQREEQRGFQPPAGKSGGFGAARNSGNSNAQQQPTPQAQPQQQQNRGLRFYGPGPHAGDWLRRNRNLPYDQQLRQLQSDPTFRNLPPQQQQHLQQRLQQFNSMSPQEQDRFLNHVDEYEHMPPGTRQEAQELYRREQGLPPSRQQAVRNAVRELNSLSPEQRQERLSSPEYRSRFTDNEREIIGQALDLDRSRTRPYRQPPE